MKLKSLHWGYQHPSEGKLGASIFTEQDHKYVNHCRWYCKEGIMQYTEQCSRYEKEICGLDGDK